MFEEERTYALNDMGEATLPADVYKVRRVFYRGNNVRFLHRGNRLKVSGYESLPVQVVVNVLVPLPVEFPPEAAESVQWLSLAKGTGDPTARFNYMSARGELSRYINQMGRTPMLMQPYKWIP